MILAKQCEVFCGKCGAQPGQPCKTIRGDEYKTGFVHNTRKLAFRRTTATGRAAIPQNFRMVHCPYCGAAPGQPCHTRAGGEVALLRESHKQRRQRFREACNMLIAASEVTPDRMAEGNWKKYPKVVMNDGVYTWRESGWVKLGSPKWDDDLLPRVIEPTFSVMVSRGTSSSFLKEA
jgi:hypothetical protein